LKFFLELLPIASVGLTDCFPVLVKRELGGLLIPVRKMSENGALADDFFRFEAEAVHGVFKRGQIERFMQPEMDLVLGWILCISQVMGLNQSIVHGPIFIALGALGDYEVREGEEIDL
jgi:hypothetical protein